MHSLANENDEYNDACIMRNLSTYQHLKDPQDSTMERMRRSRLSLGNHGEEIESKTVIRNSMCSMRDESMSSTRKPLKALPPNPNQ